VRSYKLVSASVDAQTSFKHRLCQIPKQVYSCHAELVDLELNFLAKLGLGKENRLFWVSPLDRCIRTFILTQYILSLLFPKPQLWKVDLELKTVV